MYDFNMAAAERKGWLCYGEDEGEEEATLHGDLKECEVLPSTSN